MLLVEFDRFRGPRAALNGAKTLAVRALDVARAAALTHDAVDLPRLRRAARLSAVAAELIAHLQIAPNPNGDPRLRVLGLGGLDRAARSELSHRIGVGLARTVAESAEIGIVDLYSLDAMSREDAAPRIVSVDGTRRQPDFVGCDAAGNWSLLEAKGRRAKGPMTGTRSSARAQVRAVALEDSLGRPIPITQRLTSIGRLNDEQVVVYFEDPDDSLPTRTYRFDPDQMLHEYYRLVRELREGLPTPWPGLSGAEEFRSVGLPGGFILGVHQALLDVLDEPDGIRAVRAAIRDDVLRIRREAVDAEDYAVSVGLDGLALAVRSQQLESLAYPRSGPPEDRGAT